MGVIHSTKVPKNFDKNLLDIIKNESLESILDLWEETQSRYPCTSTLTENQFCDVFGELFVDQTMKFFKKLCNDDKNLLDAYELSALLILLCSEELDKKIKALFDIFDFNRNGDLEQAEILMTAQSVNKISNFIQIFYRKMLHHKAK